MDVYFFLVLTGQALAWDPDVRILGADFICSARTRAGSPPLGCDFHPAEIVPVQTTKMAAADERAFESATSSALNNLEGGFPVLPTGFR